MKRLLILLGCLLLVGASPVAATTWDVTAEFSGTANPNGVWSYGYETSLGGTFSLFTNAKYDSSNNNSPSWDTGSALPVVWKNLGTSTIDGVQSGELSLHPGGSYGGADKPFAVIFWTAPTDIPAASTITINGAFGAGHYGTVSYYILYNNVSSSPPFEHIDDYQTELFNLTRTVSAGDTIEFIVGPDSSGSNYAGNTPLSVNIGLSSVPLPGAVWLLGSGLLGLAGLRRKLRK